MLPRDNPSLRHLLQESVDILDREWSGQNTTRPDNSFDVPRPIARFITKIRTLAVWPERTTVKACPSCDELLACSNCGWPND